MADTKESGDPKAEAAGGLAGDKPGGWLAWYIYQSRRQLACVAVGLVAFYLIPPADRGVIIYKAAVVTFAWTLWHVLRRQAFPYMDFEAALKRGGAEAIAVSLIMAASCIAIVLGISNAF